MDLKQLRQYLENLIKNLKPENKKFLNPRLGSLKSVFPFNEYEYILMFLLDKKIIPFDQYEKLREEYVSSNPYLELFSMSPRIFGEIWAHSHIIDINNKFKKPNKKLDPAYEGQYDLWLDGVKVEVKACIAINTKIRGSLTEKALKYDSNEPFWMNFQQIKADMCDAFIFIGVWVDKIIYWVLSRKEVKSNEYLSPQHRGGIEYQIGITQDNIAEFDIYKTEPHKLSRVVYKKGKNK